MASLDWDDTFGDLDARTLTHDERLDFINAEILSALNGRSGTARVGGTEGELAWDAAIRTFLEGIWVATLLCCHVVCERELAGVVSLSSARVNGDLPSHWETFGLGRLLQEARRFRMLPDELISELHALAEARKPYGHWRGADHSESLLQRVSVEAAGTGQHDWGNLAERLVVRDATQAIRTTIRLNFGSYGFGGAMPFGDSGAI